LYLLIEIIISGILGGIIGWGTNNIAINMLFKKYWKWGGVIEETYQEFIGNMSALVEKDLVNGNTLKQELSSDSFKDALKKCVEDIIKKELPESTGNLHIDDISDIDKSVENIIALIDNIQSPVLNGIYESISDSKLQSLISQKQYSYIVKTNLKNIFAKKNDYETKIQEILASFLRDKPINSIISARAIRQISENICAVIQKMDFSDFNPELDQSYEKILDKLKIDDLIKSLEKDLSGMRVSDFINDSQKLSHDLIRRVLDFIYSNEGQKTLTSVISNFLNAAGKINLKLTEVLNPGIINGIIEFCQNKLPDVIDKIARFIDSNKREIENIINNTVDDVLDRSVGGKIIKFFKDILIDNLSAKFSIVKKINDALAEYGDKASKVLSDNIVAIIKKKTIGEIIGLIVDSGVLKASLLLDLINKNIKTLENKDIKFVDRLLDRQVGDIIKSVDLKLIKTTLLPKVFEEIKKSYLYSDGFKHEINKNIKSKTTEIADREIQEIFNIEKIPITLDEKKILKSLLNLWGSISENKIEDIFGANIQAPKIPKHVFEGIWSNNRNFQLNSLYKKIQNEDSYVKASNGIIDILNENLDKLLENNISGVVNKELQKLKPQEINEMVQVFMGKEMKAINILGAVLGLVIGFATPFIGFIEIIPNNIWLKVLYYSVIFAIVGVGTNWVAIKMLFRPYKAIIKKLNFSPFAGIVAARKPKFAEEMGKFVQKRMLGKDALNSFFLDNKKTINKAMFEKVNFNNYAVIDTFLNDERKKLLSNSMYIFIKSYIIKNHKKLSNEISKSLKKLVKDGNLYDHIPELSNVIMNRLKKIDYAGLLTKVINKETKNKKLSIFKNLVEDYSDVQLTKMFDDIITKLSREITLEKVKKLISGQNEKFINFIENNTIENFAGKAIIDNMINKINIEMKPFLLNQIDPIINKLEKEEFNPDKKLKEAFGGLIPNLIKKNIGFIISYINDEICNIEDDIVYDIKEKMPWYTAPAKGKVASIVYELLHEELPKYLNKKKSVFERIADGLLEHNLGDLGFTNKSLEIDKIRNTIEKILSSPHVQNGLTHFVTIIIKELCDQPIEMLLKIINVRNINDIIQKIEPLLSTSIDHLRDNITNEKVIDIIVNTVKKVIIKSMDKIKISELIKDIDFEKELRALAKNIIDDKDIIKDVTFIIEDLLTVIEKTPEFYDGEVFKNDLDHFIMVSEDTLDKLQKTGETAIYELLTGINPALTEKTKNEICKYLINAIVSVIGYNFSGLINTIDISNVVEREINNMHPRQVEKLFYKFAGDYFHKITFYGWIGGPFGAVGVPVSLGLEQLIRLLLK